MSEPEFHRQSQIDALAEETLISKVKHLEEENAKLKDENGKLYSIFVGFCSAVNNSPQDALDLFATMEKNDPELGRMETYKATKAAIKQTADLKEEVDQLRVQLAGCSVAAASNTRNSLAKALELKSGDYGWSQSFQDVLCAVEREIELREIVDKLPKTADGVVVVPGMKLYAAAPFVGCEKEYSVAGFIYRNAQTHIGFETNPATCLYSSPEASAARAAKNKKLPKDLPKGISDGLEVKTQEVQKILEDTSRNPD